MTIVEERRASTGGVDSHSEVHVATALDPVGGLLGTRGFPATAASYVGLLGWLGKFGDVARAALSGRASGEPKGRDGAVEAIRALMVAKRSARHERTQSVNQARALILTGPDELRSRFAGLRAGALAVAATALRPRPGDAAGYARRVALRELGRRVQFLEDQAARLDELIVPLVTARAPGLLSLYGVGPNTAALLLIAAGDQPGRLRSTMLVMAPGWVRTGLSGPEAPLRIHVSIPRLVGVLPARKGTPGLQFLDRFGRTVP
jgi:transposase